MGEIILLLDPIILFFSGIILLRPHINSQMFNPLKSKKSSN